LDCVIRIPNSESIPFFNDQFPRQNPQSKNDASSGQIPQQGVHSRGEPLPPPSFEQKPQKAAIVVAHPFGGVKEQTAGLYAQKLVEEGFITLAFDAAYQGESTGEPRYLEDPFQRVEDIKNALTYLTTLDSVDPDRIGAIGVCASGGYVPFAAQTDRRIKAVATVSAADVGGLFRSGLSSSQTRSELLSQLAEAGAERTKEAHGQKPRLEHVVPNTPGEVPAGCPDLYREGTDYYRTSRAQFPTSVNWYVWRSVDLWAGYSSFGLSEVISPHPLLVIAGGEG
jgi:uncharacterized protein